MVSGSWEGFSMPPLKVMILKARTMCPFKVEESESRGCDLLCAWIRQLAAFKWSGATKHGDNVEVKAGGMGKWVGRSNRRGVFNHELPNSRISKRWEVLPEKS